MKEKIINILSGGSGEVEDFINRYLNGDKDSFFDLLERFGLLQNSDTYESVIEMFPMTYLRKSYIDDRKKTIDNIVSTYSDITKKGDKYFLTLGKRSDLSIFFKSDDGNREMSSSEMVKNILGEDDWFEPFSDVTQNLYTDVIEELNEKNKFLLAKSISEELSGTQISPETELLENMAKDQGHPDYVDVKDPMLVMDILEEDETSTKVLLDEASEVSSNLYSLHHNSYNTAYTDEKYNEIMSEVRSLLEIDNSGDWESKTIKNSKGEEKTIYNYIIEVTKFIPFLFSSIFNDDYQLDDYRNAFDYYGDFEDLTKEMITEEVIEGASMSRSYYDYADHTLVKKYLNDMIIYYV